MKINNPTQAIGATQDYINNHKLEENRILGLDLIPADTDAIEIQPINYMNEFAYVVNIKGRVHKVVYSQDELNNYPILNTSGVGLSDQKTGTAGRLNNLNNLNTSKLFWCIANEANTDITGWGWTDYPCSEIISISNGNMGSEATIVLSSNIANIYTLGATVSISRSQDYDTFNVNTSNIGVITEITSNNTIKVLLNNSKSTLLNQDLTTSVSSPGYVIQWDKLRPSVSDNIQSSNYNDTFVYNNYRLIGMANVWNTSSIASYISIRKSDSKTGISPILGRDFVGSYGTGIDANYFGSRNNGIGSTNINTGSETVLYPWIRFSPPWAAKWNVTAIYTINNSDIIINSGVGLYFPFRERTFTTGNPVGRRKSFSMKSDARKVFSMVSSVSSGGDVEFGLSLNYYEDGGLKEL